jgi:hypothetical protein
VERGHGGTVAATHAEDTAISQAAEDAATCVMKIFTDYDDTTPVNGSSGSAITYSTSHEGYVHTFADYAEPFDVVKVRVESGADPMQQRATINAIVLHLSPRASRRSAGG